jgi:calcium binding protein
MRGSTPLKRTATTKTRGSQTPARLSKERLAEMIEEATVDAYDESEQATGWYTMFEQYLELPFETTVLGVAVTIASVDLRENNQIVAVCTRGRDRQAISLVDLPLPSPKPAGSEWIEAYRHWMGQQ